MSHSASSLSHTLKQDSKLAGEVAFAASFEWKGREGKEELYYIDLPYTLRLKELRVEQG